MLASIGPSQNTKKLNAPRICYGLQLKFTHPLSYFLKMASSANPCLNPSSAPPNPESFLQKVDKKKNQEIDFISQFLALPIKASSLPYQRNEPFLDKKQKSVAISKTVGGSDCSIDNPTKETKIKSLFHNFQKHLVVTLRSSVKLKTSHKRDPILNLAYKMWRIFTESHLFCKKILHFLFGVVNLTPEENYLQMRNYAIPGSQTLLTSYSISQFSAAQEFLRAGVVRQGYKLVERNVLSSRRMQKNDEFESYFLSFLEELQSGSLSRRLPKSEKLQIVKEIQRIKDEVS